MEPKKKIKQLEMQVKQYIAEWGIEQEKNAVLREKIRESTKLLSQAMKKRCTHPEVGLAYNKLRVLVGEK